MIPVTGVPQSKVPGSGDHPLLPQVEVITSLGPPQVKVSMDPPIVTGGVLVMVTPAAVDGVGHKTKKEYNIHTCVIIITTMEWLTKIHN